MAETLQVLARPPNNSSASLPVEYPQKTVHMCWWVRCHVCPQKAESDGFWNLISILCNSLYSQQEADFHLVKWQCVRIQFSYLLCTHSMYSFMLTLCTPTYIHLFFWKCIQQREKRERLLFIECLSCTGALPKCDHFIVNNNTSLKQEISDLSGSSGSPGMLMKTQTVGPHPQVSASKDWFGVWPSAFLVSYQVMLQLLVHGPHFETHSFLALYQIISDKEFEAQRCKIIQLGRDRHEIQAQWRAAILQSMVTSAFLNLWGWWICTAAGLFMSSTVCTGGYSCQILWLGLSQLTLHSGCLTISISFCLVRNCPIS